ncbi:ATP-binding cassette sub- B member 5, partial [Podila verticillata]
MSSQHSNHSDRFDEIALTIPETDEEKIAREKKEAARKLKLAKAPIARTIQYVRQDWALCLVGCFFAIIQGALFPGFSQVFSRALTTLTEKDSPDFIPNANHYSLIFLFIAFVGFAGFAGGMVTFLIVGERVTRKMRYLSYRAILSQEMAFFDRPENSTGALTSPVPVIGLGQYLEIAALTGFGEKTRKAYEHSGQVAGEAIANIRTVVSLAKEDRFEQRYEEVTRQPHRYAMNKAIYASFGFAMSQAVSYWSYSIGFYGGYRL